MSTIKIKTLIFLFVAAVILVAESKHGFAELPSREELPIHILVETTNTEPESPVPNSSSHVSVLVEGTIKEIYKDEVSSTSLQPMAVHDAVRLQITCYPATYKGVRWDDDPSPTCNSLEKGSSIEIWASPVADGTSLLVMYAHAK